MTSEHRLDVSTVTEQELARARAARAFVHESTCPNARHSAPGCPACPSAAGIVLSLRLLDGQARDVRTVRRALHDQVCQSACGPESDHADRTQSRTASALRKFHRSPGAGHV